MKLFNLFQIELNKNKLTGENLEILLNNCPRLYKIKLENNLIDNFDTLKCLANFKLKKINLAGNPIVNTNPEYRKQLFDMVESLESIDGIDRKGDKVESTVYGGEEDDEEGEEGEDELYNDDGEDEEEGELPEEDDEDEGDYGEDDDDGDDDDDERPQKKPKE